MVGPTGGYGRDLQLDEVVTEAGSWLVQVEAIGPGRAALGAMFDDCNDGGSTCPATSTDPGAVAIVLDGMVVSAPAVQSLGLADEPFVIVASDEAEARRLAAAIGG